MASLDQHKEDCLRFLGDDCAEVNRWMDQYFKVFGPYHRKCLHHREGVEEARQIFGDRGAVAAAIHILRDCRHIPRKKDYELGYVDALGLKKQWSTAAYVTYSDEEFENVVTQMLKPSGLLLWGFLNEDAVRFFLTSLTRHENTELDQLLKSWRDARRKTDTLPPLLASIGNIEIQPTDVTPEDERAYLADLSESALVKSIKGAFGGAEIAYVPVEQLVQPLVCIDYEYLEELKPEIASSDPIDIIKFAIPEQITTQLKAVADPTQRSAMFISNQKSLTVSPMRVRSTPEGTEVSFMVTANATGILVSQVSGRLLLKSGIHRAYLLAQMGCARIPCVLIREHGFAPVSTAYPAFAPQLLVQPRPPLLIDLFKPELCVQVPLQRTHKLIRITADEAIVPID